MTQFFSAHWCTFLIRYKKLAFRLYKKIIGYKILIRYEVLVGQPILAAAGLPAGWTR
jgi:hypothetical protein